MVSAIQMKQHAVARLIAGLLHLPKQIAPITLITIVTGSLMGMIQTARVKAACQEKSRVAKILSVAQIVVSRAFANKLNICFHRSIGQKAALVVSKAAS